MPPSNPRRGPQPRASREWRPPASAADDHVVSARGAHNPARPVVVLASRGAHYRCPLAAFSRPLRPARRSLASLPREAGRPRPASGERVSPDVAAQVSAAPPPSDRLDPREGHHVALGLARLAAARFRRRRWVSGSQPAMVTRQWTGPEGSIWLRGESFTSPEPAPLRAFCCLPLPVVIFAPIWPPGALLVSLLVPVRPLPSLPRPTRLPGHNRSG